MGLNPRFVTITDHEQLLREDWLTTCMEIPCTGPPNLAFPNVIIEVVQETCRLKMPPKIIHFFAVEFSQGFPTEIANLKQPYFTNDSNATTFTEQNLQFVSDFNLVYASVKAAALQSQANDPSGLFGFLDSLLDLIFGTSSKNVFMFRLLIFIFQQSCDTKI